MTFNLHTHTTRCRHARGTEREYIENAIQGGLKTLGFSDHAPYIFPNGYYSTYRMYPEEQNSYVDTLLALKEEYKKEIDIYIGYEAEYYPPFFDAFLRMITSRPVDYLIMGQHFLGDEMSTHEYTGDITTDPEFLVRYVDQVLEGLTTGVFTYLAHPDLCRFEGENSVFDKEYSRLILGAKEMSIPLEINLLGLWEKRHYPKERFWELCGEHQAPVIIGADAHTADTVADMKTYEEALKMCERCHISPISLPKFRMVGI